MTETEPTSDLAQVTVLLVTFNSALVIDDCLNSLSSAPNIIVVDNASTDETCDIITNRFPQVNLVRNSINKGFSAGVNLGMAKVETTFALYFSPDAVLMENAMEILVKTALQNPEAALIGPLLQSPNSRPERFSVFRGQSQDIGFPLQQIQAVEVVAKNSFQTLRKVFFFEVSQTWQANPPSTKMTFPFT